MKKLNSFNVASVKSANANVEVPTNHIFVIDCSGSMYYDLPKMRLQLKNKLPMLVKQSDTVSLVWFSGKGEFGKLVDKVNVNDLNDLNRLNIAIDRWLKPMGCTGFVEPLHTVKDLCNDNGVYSMMFLTDGYDNEWGRNEILQGCAELSSLLANAVFVEYGYYCNHSLLTDMANAVNGGVLFAEDFEKYEPMFENIVKRRITAKRVAVEVGTPLEGIVWSCSENGAITYKVDNGKVYVPEDVDNVYWFTADDESKADMDYKPLYQGLSVFALNRKADIVRSALAEIGDVALFNQYTNAYGKQNLYDFAENLCKASEDETARFTQGRQAGLQANDNAYTVIDFLNGIRHSDVMLDLSRLHYNRIGRKAEMSEELSKDEAVALADKMASSSSANEIREATNNAIRLASERAKMKFAYGTQTPKLNGFTFNENRPNVSMLFKIDGSVELPTDAPSTLPRHFDTYVWRNFTVIKDGLLNIEKLPLIASDEQIADWQSKGVPFTMDGGTCIVDLRSMPMINSRMVKSVNANQLANRIYEYMHCKASGKVYTAFLEEIEPKEKSADLKAMYGDECAEYLKSVGITDNGFAPKTKLATATDKYMGVEFNVKFKGISSIPSYNALVKKLTSGKALTNAESLLKSAYDECVAQKSALTQDEFAKWLKSKIAEANKQASEYYEKIVEDKFAIIIGQTWFADLDVNNPTLENHGIAVTFEIKDVEVEI